MRLLTTTPLKRHSIVFSSKYRLHQPRNTNGFNLTLHVTGHFVQHCTSTIWKLCSNSRSTTTSKETEDTNLSKRVKLDKSSKLPATMSDEDLQTWGLETQEVLDFIVKDKHDKDTLFCDTGKLINEFSEALL